MQTKNLCPDDFFFDSMELTEDILRYTLGGYCPIIVGNILSDPSGKSSYTYRIVNKLGYGHNATVWLAQQIDNAGNRTFVAVKVTTADVETGIEASILEAASMPEPSNILSYLDSFTMQSPNGTHSVIVTDVVAPISCPTSPRLYKEFAYGLAQGLAHLHAAGIVHGDLHLGNVGLAMPQLALQDPEDVMVDLQVQDITLVLPTDPANQSASLPAYLLMPCDLRSYHARIANGDPLRIKIIDFGSARISGVSPLHPQCAIAVSPPEAAFAQNIEKTGNPLAGPPADIWAFGADLYESITGGPLIHWANWTSLFASMTHIAQVPPKWEKSWKSSGCSPEMSPDTFWAKTRGALRKGCVDEEDLESLVRLLRKVLVLDPAMRTTAAEILRDPWFRDIPKSSSEKVPPPTTDNANRSPDLSVLCI